MKKGDCVIYVKDPLMFGPMKILSVRADGHLTCQCSDCSLEVFHPQELELYELVTSGDAS